FVEHLFKNSNRTALELITGIVLEQFSDTCSRTVIEHLSHKFVSFNDAEHFLNCSRTVPELFKNMS
ncbi:MAG: hypothetical protein ABW185_28935, partial [Sedimenticola sp.]